MLLSYNFAEFSCNVRLSFVPFACIVRVACVRVAFVESFRLSFFVRSFRARTQYDVRDNVDCHALSCKSFEALKL